MLFNVLLLFAILVASTDVAFCQKTFLTPTVISGHNEACPLRDVIDEARQNVSSIAQYYILCRSSRQHDCKALLDSGCTVSGVYTIQPDNMDPIEVYCDMETDGGGWTVFQRRQDGSQNFIQTFDPYVQGFGDRNGEFWLGLDAIVRLTPARGSTSLRVDLRDLQGNSGYSIFDTFGVTGSSDYYRLTVARFSGGNAGDSLTIHSGITFHSNIGHPGCATDFSSGWWFQHNLINGICFHSNLNGPYTPRPDRQNTGIRWLSFSPDALTFSEMKLRRRN